MPGDDEKKRAPRNRTLVLSRNDRERLRPFLLDNIEPHKHASPEGVILGDCIKYAKQLPNSTVDLLFLDPPYNMTKSFHGFSFSKKSVDDYADWLESIIIAFKPALKPTATIYICGDWCSSPSIFRAASAHYIVRNRITWEREKGRGALKNWKNSCEDIWYCTVSDDYLFDLEAVKIRRRVIAPYTNSDGSPKDWQKTSQGGFRDTHPSNFWTDITIPFWSMPENTDHPTQKSEKLLAKLLLASTKPGDYVLDPFMGSGTTNVVAKKLNRRALGIEINEEYALWALRRLELANIDASIQGYTDGVFWERNTLASQVQNGTGKKEEADDGNQGLFGFIDKSAPKSE